MRNWLFALPFIIIISVIGLFGLSNFFSSSDELSSTAIGQLAPKVQLEPLADSIPFAQVDLMRGQVTLVNFWASWCAPCRAEHVTLMELAAHGVPIMGVNYKDSPDNASAFLSELGTPYLMGGADPQARMALDWGVYGLPETFVLDPNGKVLQRVTGPLTQRNLETRVLPMLKDAGLSLY